jgi:hypothetical protein
MLRTILVAASLSFLAARSLAAEEAVRIPVPAVDQGPAPAGLRTAVIAGGCFWGVPASQGRAQRGVRLLRRRGVDRGL